MVTSWHPSNCLDAVVHVWGKQTTLGVSTGLFSGVQSDLSPPGKSITTAGMQEQCSNGSFLLLKRFIEALMKGYFHIIDKNTELLPWLYFRVIYLFFFHCLQRQTGCWTVLTCTFVLHMWILHTCTCARLDCCTFFCCSAVSQVSSVTCWSPDASRGAAGMVIWWILICRDIGSFVLPSSITLKHLHCCFYWGCTDFQ